MTLIAIQFIYLWNGFQYFRECSYSCVSSTMLFLPIHVPRTTPPSMHSRNWRELRSMFDRTKNMGNMRRTEWWESVDVLRWYEREARLSREHTMWMILFSASSLKSLMHQYSLIYSFIYLFIIRCLSQEVNMHDIKWGVLTQTGPRRSWTLNSRSTFEVHCSIWTQSDYHEINMQCE